MTLPSLPVLDVYMAFNPTYGGTTLATASQQALPASGASNAYWTNISVHCRAFTSGDGRQHYLDRMEAGTLTARFSNRSGYFLNGSANASGYVVAPRMPIAVTLTVSGITYSAFWGLTESIPERIADQLNAEISVQSSDLLKYLALYRMMNSQFWPTYAKSAAATNWYRCSLDASSTFTLPDQIGTSNGIYASNAYPSGINGLVAFPNYGAILYDTDPCVDLSNGTQTPHAYIKLPMTIHTGLDFLFIGAGSNGQTIVQGCAYTDSASTSHTLSLVVLSNVLQAQIVTGGTTTYVSSGITVTDGNWHHVGWYVSGGVLSLWCDGTATTIASLSASAQYVNGPAGGVTIGMNSSNFEDLAAYIDEVVVSGSVSPTYAQPSVSELQNRYRAFSLLRLPNVWSGDRIAEILCVAGFGSISSGVLSVPSFSIANAYKTPVAYSAGGTNGSLRVEPYYWDSPPQTSTALDLILQVTDTDVGSFYQTQDGKFRFNSQTYYGSWSWNPATNTGTWTPSYTAPTGAQVWSDDASSSYPYIATSGEIVRDDADLWTLVVVSPQSGRSQVYENTAAQARWGHSTLQKSATVHNSLTAALSTATFLGYLYRSPLPRASGVEMDSVANNGGNLLAMLTTQLGDVVSFTRNAPNASTTGSYPDQMGKINAQPMVVERIGLDFSADEGRLSATFTLDPYPIRT